MVTGGWDEGLEEPYRDIVAFPKGLGGGMGSGTATWPDTSLAFVTPALWGICLPPQEHMPSWWVWAGQQGNLAPMCSSQLPHPLSVTWPLHSALKSSVAQVVMSLQWGQLEWTAVCQQGASTSFPLIPRSTAGPPCSS